MDDGNGVSWQDLEGSRSRSQRPCPSAMAQTHTEAPGGDSAEAEAAGVAVVGGVASAAFGSRATEVLPGAGKSGKARSCVQSCPAPARKHPGNGASTSDAKRAERRVGAKRGFVCLYETPTIRSRCVQV